MTNKEIIQRVNDGFALGDNEIILAHMADDVRWEAPGEFVAIGKDEVRAKLDNSQFDGIPVIIVTNEIADGDRIAVEGSVKGRKSDGSDFNAAFCDTYLLEAGKVKRMTSYLRER